MRDRRVPLFLIGLLLKTLFNIGDAYADADDAACHPTPNPRLAQYVIGYGSLLETASKKRTDPTSGKNYPVKVYGYQRAWLARGLPIGFSTTFLGIIRDTHAYFNGTIFRLNRPHLIKNYDARENVYCRNRVSCSAIHRLDGLPLPKGQFWMYVTKPEYIAPPSKNYPIVQSYVDIFLSGCLEIQKQFHLKNFTLECIQTTQGWSRYWVNDRLFPRRAISSQPNAYAIDDLLEKIQPEAFKQIKIES